MIYFTMSHQDAITLKDRLVKARVLVPPGSHWAHYKTPDVAYEIVDIGFIEATEEAAVMYKTPDNSLVWIRPLAIFLSSARRDDGTEGPRFIRLT